jgi:hypothetical protein
MEKWVLGISNISEHHQVTPALTLFDRLRSAVALALHL